MSKKSEALNEFNEQCIRRNTEPVKGACTKCENAIFSTSIIPEKTIKEKEKKGKLYQHYDTVYYDDENVLTLNCYCGIMHFFVDEIKTFCDGLEEPEPKEI